MSLVIGAAMNGRIPATLLASVPGQPSRRLARDAAASFGRLADHVVREYGWRPYLNTAYRTVAEQDALVNQGLTTVSGGRSEHGLGRAVDVDGLGGFKGKRYAEFAHLARLHGWYQPSWATSWRPEPWHWEYDPDRDQYAGGAIIAPPTPITKREWDEMATQAEVEEALAKVLRGLDARQLANIAVRKSDGVVGMVVGNGVRHLQPSEWSTLRNLGYRETPNQQAMDDGPFAKWVTAHGGWDPRGDDGTAG